MTTPKPVAVSDQTKPMLTLDGLCQHCAAQTGLVMTLLKEGVAQWAQGKATATWRFSRVPVRRVTTAWRPATRSGYEASQRGAGLAAARQDGDAARSAHPHGPRRSPDSAV